MRHLAAAGLVALVTLALAGCTGQRLRSDHRSGMARLGDCHVFVLNKSSEEVISAVVYVDGEEVLSDSVPQYSDQATVREVRLRLPLGVHRVRVVVGSETSEIEVDVTSIQPCKCQIIYYDEPGDRFGPNDYRRLAVQQIYPC